MSYRSRPGTVEAETGMEPRASQLIVLNAIKGEALRTFRYESRPIIPIFASERLMNFITMIISTAEIAIATIILWFVVELLTIMPANMRMVVKCLIVLVAILVVISMLVASPVREG
jgi:hypothetical protein